MKVLPPVTLPWSRPIHRRHAPDPASGNRGYRRYRPCLRWEFGFTCAFCLCHEADYLVHGAEGTGLFQVEHFHPSSLEPAKLNDYSNCFYICRFCNTARGATAVKTPDGSELFDPCDRAWDELFEVVDDVLRPRPTERSRYTYESYDLGDPRKTQMRRHRRRTLAECAEVLERGPNLRERLLDRSLETNDPVWVEVAEWIDSAIFRARRDLLKWRPIPWGTPPECFCEQEGTCTLPEVLHEQLIEIELTEAAT